MTVAGGPSTNSSTSLPFLCDCTLQPPLHLPQPFETHLRQRLLSTKARIVDDRRKLLEEERLVDQQLAQLDDRASQHALERSLALVRQCEEQLEMAKARAEYIKEDRRFAAEDSRKMEEKRVREMQEAQDECMNWRAIAEVHRRGFNAGEEEDDFGFSGIEAIENQKGSSDKVTLMATPNTTGVEISVVVGYRGKTEDCGFGEIIATKHSEPVTMTEWENAAKTQLEVPSPIRALGQPQEQPDPMDPDTVTAFQYENAPSPHWAPDISEEPEEPSLAGTVEERVEEEASRGIQSNRGVRPSQKRSFTQAELEGPVEPEQTRTVSRKELAAQVIEPAKTRVSTRSSNVAKQQPTFFVSVPRTASVLSQRRYSLRTRTKIRYPYIQVIHQKRHYFYGKQLKLSNRTTSGSIEDFYSAALGIPPSKPYASDSEPDSSDDDEKVAVRLQELLRSHSEEIAEEVRELIADASN